MQDCAIETHHLRKEFNSRVAVADLDLSVRRGKVFGFLGPNGAGKSTSIKMLLGLVAPSGGHALVLGQPVGHLEVRRKLGFLPEHFRFHDWLTGEEFLRLHGKLYGMPPAHIGERADALLKLVGLAPHRKKRLREFSKGMLQRIGLAQALLNDPELIFLDEPTSGLDPAGRMLVRDIMREQRSRGATVFLNSHLLGEVELTCDRVAFIKHGEVLEVRDLKMMAPEEITVTVRARRLCPELVAGLERWADSVRHEGEHLTLTVGAEQDLPEIVAYLVAGGAEVYEFTSKQPSLEELFLDIVGTDGGL